MQIEEIVGSEGRSFEISGFEAK
jgi:hypothetical protein